MVDKAVFGEALARTLDRLEKLEAKGDLDGYEISDVVVVAGFLKPAENRSEIEPDAIDSLIFVDGTTQIPYVQAGLLYLALDTAVHSEPEE